MVSLRNADESQRRLIKCWVYTLSDFPDALLAKPMLASYASTAEQPYHERSVRLANVRAKDDLEF